MTATAGSIHILGICGTFMGGLARLAREAGYRVTGSDANVYPPMSTQLGAAGIRLQEGYRAEHLRPAPDCVVVGNALSRGNPAVEYLLDEDLVYDSGPGWLSRHLLQGRWVLAVAGTHGKTTTASMLAWILEHAGLAPGFLIGGVPHNFGVSARLGGSRFFVIEADEYDTAFFDKRAKFVHYRPRTLVLNNLEFDHADIYPDLASIQRQFHHLVRILPATGRLLVNAADPALAEVLAMGCWTPVERVSAAGGAAEWAALPDAAGSGFQVRFRGKVVGRLDWTVPGGHNRHNALSAIAAAHHVGVPVSTALAALARFEGVARRLEVRGVAAGVTVYDDFAHHPTAVATTLEGLRGQQPARRLLVVLEPRSNTMRLGVHRRTLGPALAAADRAWLYQPPDLGWEPGEVAASAPVPVRVAGDIDALVAEVVAEARPGDAVVVMSNGAFGGIHQRLLDALGRREAGHG